MNLFASSTDTLTLDYDLMRAEDEGMFHRDDAVNPEGADQDAPGQDSLAMARVAR